jgi:hypothetical protein
MPSPVYPARINSLPPGRVRRGGRRGGRREEEGGRRKEEGGRRKKKEEGGRRKEGGEEGGKGRHTLIVAPESDKRGLVGTEPHDPCPLLLDGAGKRL